MLATEALWLRLALSPSSVACQPLFRYVSNSAKPVNDAPGAATSRTGTTKAGAATNQTGTTEAGAKRAPSAYSLFTKDFARNRTAKGNLMQGAAAAWKTMSEVEKQKFVVQAADLKKVLNDKLANAASLKPSATVVQKTLPRPLNPYATFVQKTLPRLRTLQRDTPVPELMKKVAEQYKNLSSEEKERLKQEYRDARAAYEEKQKTLE